MLDELILYQWEIFITAEVLSLAALILCGAVRYFFGKRRLSLLFLVFFLVLLITEAGLAILIYQETGEISNFLIIITIFVIYACTFGIFDFMKLDRWMRKKIGGWRGVDLLSDKDRRIMARQKDPKYVAMKYRWSSMAHLTVFSAAQFIFWIYGTSGLNEMASYITDLSWIGAENAAETPYANDTIYGISMVWAIVFIIDFIYSWSFTIFPSKPKG
ncbi:hypothetical protein [Virgibacillus sp. YIM 98842]|uniref:hypothetical protein n=1 Tax=Virgibacillus sp. YIM 98842 TaxID=2663533 RepID=UPI0013DA30AD|nr:hypothetical protein [Virgibacillus sp. YIM 98842]